MVSANWWARTISAALRRLSSDPAVNKLATTIGSANERAMKWREERLGRRGDGRGGEGEGGQLWSRRVTYGENNLLAGSRMKLNAGISSSVDIAA